MRPASAMLPGLWLVGALGCGPLEPRLVVNIVVRQPVTSATPGCATPHRAPQAALQTLAPLRDWLAAHGATEVKPRPLLDGLSAEVPARLLPELRAFPGVVRVNAGEDEPNDERPGGPTPWHLTAIGAPLLWQQGVRGAGVVVASLDTGVDGRHPDLASRWRGRPGDWFDPFSSSTTPFDSVGHGTQTLGLMVGEETGVAPEAQWIAARLYDADGRTSVEVLHRALAWVLDPDGDPATDDAPQVVNVSWGFDSPGVCVRTFEPELQALRAAGVLVVFAAGNAGPAAFSSVSPANNPGAFSVGAVDDALALADFSSRGPSACGPAPFPSLLAPGTSLRTTDRSGDGQAAWTTVTGTSFASPLVAGAAALLRSAARRSPMELEQALLAGAQGHEGEAGVLDVERAAWTTEHEPPAQCPEP